MKLILLFNNWIYIIFNGAINLIYKQCLKYHSDYKTDTYVISEYNITMNPYNFTSYDTSLIVI